MEPGRILIVDDEVEVLETVKKMLVMGGMSVQTFTQGNDAISLLARQQVDVVVTDMRMPGMDGLELMKRVRILDKDVSFVVLTGYASLENAIEAFEIGGPIEYLQKPIETIDDAIRAVERAVEKCRLKRKNREVLEQLKKAKIDLEKQLEHRRRMDRRLQQSEELFREMVDHIQEVFWLFDWDNQKVVYVSPAFESIWGRPVEDLYQNYDIWSDSIHPEDIQYAEESFAEILETGGGQIREYRIRRPDREVRWISDTGWVIRDHQSQIRRITGVAMDITDRKTMERDIMAAKKMESIASLAGGIAHQFNNQLTVITSGLDLMEPFSHNAEERIDTMQEMKTASFKMAELTTQLLAYANGGKYNCQVYSPCELIRNTIPVIKHAINPAISIEMDLSDTADHIEADSTQLQLVISAILSNASEAMDNEGNIRITCKNMAGTRENLPYGFGLNPGPFVCITFRDTGEGMDTETRNRMFEPFYSTRFQGRGLGLAAVYGIVRNHNGGIGVETQPGKGTTIRIYLPAFEKEQQSVVSGKYNAHSANGNILLVEDEEQVRRIMKTMLERLGYHVLEAESGRSAIEIAERFEGVISLAILDLVLPDMHGKDVYPLLMAHRKNLKVLISSGFSLDERIQEILNAGADGFIQKPFTMDRLSAELERMTH